MPRPPSNFDVISRNTYLKTLSLETLRLLGKQAGCSAWKTLTQQELIEVLTSMTLNNNPLSTATNPNIQ
jgi:hypothetical protein